jgi:hypothetical protein
MAEKGASKWRQMVVMGLGNWRDLDVSRERGCERGKEGLTFVTVGRLPFDLSAQHKSTFQNKRVFLGAPFRTHFRDYLQPLYLRVCLHELVVTGPLRVSNSSSGRIFEDNEPANCRCVHTNRWGVFENRGR